MWRERRGGWRPSSPSMLQYRDNGECVCVWGCVSVWVCDLFNMHRHKSSPFHVVLVGGDELVSSAVQAMAVAHTRGLSPGVLTFSIVPTGKKETSDCVKEEVVSVLN